MSYRRNDESESESSFDPSEYSTNRRHRKNRRRGSAKTKGACRGGDGKFMSCDECGARPNAASRKRKSTKKSSKRSSWGGSEYTGGGRKTRKGRKGGYKKYESRGGYDRVRPGSKGRATVHGGATRKGVRDSISADKDIQKATAILRTAKNKVTGIPRDALTEILKLLKYALDT